MGPPRGAGNCARPRRHGISSATTIRPSSSPSSRLQGGDSMKRWLPGLLVLALAALLALPLPAAAQGKDTLTVALPSHAPTLDPHMHFERVGILVNINMFDSLLHRSAKLGEEAFGSTSAVCTVTWKFVEWKRDQHIKLEAFDQHWRGKPALKYLVFRAILEVATAVAELKTGGVDIIRNVNADLLNDIKDHPQTKISTTPILRVHYISLDMRSAPFDKKTARQAANYAIDKQAMLQKMMAGLGRQVATVVQPAAFGFDPSVPVYPYDAKKAKELLTQAGYPNGVDITMHSSSVDWRPHFEALGQMLTEVGLRTTVKMWDPGPAWNKFFQAEGKATNAQYGSWGNYSVFDADAVLHPLYHTEPGGWIGKHYARVEGLDKLIDDARSSADQPKRKQIYARIQSMIREEAPSVFLWTQNDTLGISKKVAYEARPDEWLWLFAAKPKN